MPTYQLFENLELSVEVEGDTGTASQIKIAAKKNGAALPQEFTARCRVCNVGSQANSTNAVLAVVSGKGTVVKTWTSDKDLEIEGITNRAKGTLTISGVVIDGQTFTLGPRVYEFDDDGVITSPRVAVDISPYSIKAQGTLTIAEPVTAGDTIQIGDATYIFVANGTGNSAGEIDLGANEAATKVNIVAAINGTDDYNDANALVSASAFVADICTLTARKGGTAGNAIVTVELGQGLTHASNVFDATTMGDATLGVDCTAANAVLAVVNAINTDVSAVVTAVDGAGNTVDVVAKVGGTAPNAYASTETMVNGAFGGVTLAGGGATAISEFWVSITNAVAETVTLRIGSPEFGGLAVDYVDKFLNITHGAP